MGYRARPNSPKRTNSKGQQVDKYKQGQYNILNLEKYLGDPSVVYYRSSWEFKLYYFLDNEPRIIHWNVEGITIPYEIETGGKWETCRYHPDAFAEIQKLDGTISKTVLEIKPHAETTPPVMPKRITAKSLENHEYRMKMFLKNLAKWKAAKTFCEKRGMDFFVMTEKFFEGHSVKIF